MDFEFDALEPRGAPETLGPNMAATANVQVPAKPRRGRQKGAGSRHGSLWGELHVHALGARRRQALLNGEQRPGRRVKIPKKKAEEQGPPRGARQP